MSYQAVFTHSVKFFVTKLTSQLEITVCLPCKLMVSVLQTQVLHYLEPQLLGLFLCMRLGK